VATAEIAGTRFKIHSTVMVEGKGNAAPGTILALTKTGLQIACAEGAVEIRMLQAEGGKRMAAPDYFRGHPLEM
jgi:methionyl-tRNA formyltransferase